MAPEADLTTRILELERRMDLLFDRLALKAPRLVQHVGELGADVQELLDRGDREGAIALVREQTGMSLSEARRTVEQIVGGS